MERRISKVEVRYFSAFNMRCASASEVTPNRTSLYVCCAIEALPDFLATCSMASIFGCDLSVARMASSHFQQFKDGDLPDVA